MNMTTERFNEVVKEQLERIEKLLVKKQAEYNLDADRLSVFKHGAAMSKETPEQVLYGFLLKHLISQADMISTDACVINNQLCDYPTKSLSGVGMVYKFCSYIDELLNVDFAD